MWQSESLHSGSFGESAKYDGKCLNLNVREVTCQELRLKRRQMNYIVT